MKVFFFIHSLHGGGAESQCRYLARGLAERGCDVHLVFADGDPSVLEDAGITLHRLPSGSNYAFSQLRHVWRLVRAHRPDLVQTWTLKFDVLLGMIRQLQRFTWVIRESNNLTGQAPGLKGRLRLALGRRACVIVANSPGGADYWRQHSAQRVQVIENGYDFSFLDSLTADPQHAGPGYVCYLGRLAPHKRVDRLIRAMSCLERRAPLAVIGDGPERAALENLADSLRVPAVFHGYLPQGEALSLVAGASALVLLSDYEGTPNVVLEAQYLGVPVILSDSDSHTGFFPAEVAGFVPSGDEDAVAAEIRQCLSDDDTVRSRVAAAKTFAAGWSLERMVSRYHALYEDITGNG